MEYFKKLMLVLVISLPFGAYAQGFGDEDTQDTEDVPLDGGLSIMAAAGIAYGVKKLYKKNKHKNENDTVAETKV
jgi:hypothetical protein